MRFIKIVVIPGPGVDVDHSIRRDHEMASVTNALGKHAGTKAFGQIQSGIVARARRLLTRTGTGPALSRSQRLNKADHGNGEDAKHQDLTQAERAHEALRNIGTNCGCDSITFFATATGRTKQNDVGVRAPKRRAHVASCADWN